MKLIDADKAFEVLSEYYHHRTYIQHDALREALDRVPEAVVRCKDCRYYDKGKNESEEWSECRYYWYVSDFDVSPDCFCSRGERRSDETD